MSTKKQKKYFEILRRYERKMDSKERGKYKMLVKRNKDEEELDKISLDFLEDLYTKYYVNREKKDFSSFFNS